MAGNTSSGNVLVFRMTEEQLAQAIEKYKIDLENGNKFTVEFETFDYKIVELKK